MNLIENKYTIEELEEYISSNGLQSIDWDYISIYQTLTESFIEKYIENIYWRGISWKQTLSE